MRRTTRVSLCVWVILLVAGCKGNVHESDVDAFNVLRSSADCDAHRATCDDIRESCSQDDLSRQEQNSCTRMLRDCDRDIERYCSEPVPSDGGEPVPSDGGEPPPADSGGASDAGTVARTQTVRVMRSSDDAEEAAGGSMYLESSDLELVYDGSNQTVGLRFSGIEIPQGSTISRATIQFTVDETESVSSSLVVAGHYDDDAPSFTDVAGNISSRALTGATVAWSPAAWATAEAAGPDQQTPNLAAIVQEIVARPGWNAGQAMVFIFQGSGERVAHSYDGSSSQAPLLELEWGQEPSGQACGDGTCDLDEDCTTCAADCGACPSTCGDGTCSAGEDCDTCSADCSCPSACGDGSCDTAESCSSCSADCGICAGGTGPDFPGAITHSDAISVSSIPSMPGYLETTADPDFNTTITRITGDPGTAIPGLSGASWSTKNRAAYQSHQAWNADGSMIFLEFGGLFIDGNNYTVAHRTSPPGGLPYWSPVEPAYMFSVGDNEVYRFNAFTESSETWITFSDYSDLVGQVWNSPSIDGRVLAVKARRNSDGKMVCLAIDLVNRTSIVDVPFESVGLTTTGNKAQRCRTAASGNYFALRGGDESYYFDLAGNQVSSHPVDGNAHCPGHGDHAIDTNGDDVLVGVCKNGPLAWELVTFRIRDGSVRFAGAGTIGGVYAVPHTSGRSTARPGWAYSAGYGDLNDEIRAYRLDGNRVERLCHVFSTTDDYWAQTQTSALTRWEKDPIWHQLEWRGERRLPFVCGRCQCASGRSRLTNQWFARPRSWQRAPVRRFIVGKAG